MTRFHYLQHAAFEDPAQILEYAQTQKWVISSTHIYKNESLPEASDFDWLVVMGGPMGVGDDERYPWLVDEKRLVEEALKQGKPVVGICLGAQLMADVLGSTVTRNRHREIGWFPVHLTDSAKGCALLHGVPVGFNAFHWHGDTFRTPQSAVRIAESEACVNQGFVYGDRAIALQFHLESNFHSIKKMIDNCKGDMVPGPHVQTPEEIFARGEPAIASANNIMIQLFDNLARVAEKGE